MMGSERIIHGLSFSLFPADTFTVRGIFGHPHRFSGKVFINSESGKSVTTMFLTTTDPVSNISYGNYVLTLGQAVSTYSGTCPGP